MTVLMSVRNGGPYIKEAVSSILNQSYDKFDFLILDNASTDNTKSIINEFKDSRIKLVELSNDIGQSSALNKGLAMINTKYVARMDADDVSLYGRLEKQVEYLENHPNVALICSYEHTINSNGVKILDWKKHIQNYGQFIGEIILGQCPVWHPSVMYKKDVVEKLGYYNTQYGLAEDYELWAKFALNRYEAAVVPEFHLLQREHGARQSILSYDMQIKAVSILNQNVINYFYGDKGLNTCISSFLRLQKDPCGIGLKGNHLKEIIRSVIALFHSIEEKKNLSIPEEKYFYKAIHRRLGYGIEIGYYFIFLPNFIFTGLFFILSPMYFFKIRNLFAIIYRKIRELKYIKNSILHN